MRIFAAGHTAAHLPQDIHEPVNENGLGDIMNRENSGYNT